MNTTAATYVQISREDLEDWLEGLQGLYAKWYRAPNKAGVYLLPLSETVAVKLLSTIGSSDDAMGRGMASMQLMLVSLVTGQTLNKKAQGQDHFKRTTNWKKTWQEGILRMKEAYTKAQGFYDALAAIKDRDAYREDVMRAIEGMPDWRNHHILSDFHAAVERGGILTTKQLALMERTLDQAKPAPAPQTPTEEDPILNVLRALYRAGRAKEDEWLMKFAEDVAKQVNAGRPLSQRQEEVIQINRTRYKVGMSDRVAHRYLGGIIHDLVSA